MSRRVTSQILYFGLRTILGIGGRLPLPLNRAIGVTLGRSALRLSKRNRTRILTNLEIAFPHLDPESRDQLVRDIGRHFGLLLGEISWLWRASPSKIEALCVVEGSQHLIKAHRAGRGVILVTAHCGNWELIRDRLMSLGIPCTVVVRRLDDPKLDRMTTQFRTRFGTSIIHREPTAGRLLVRALARNEVLALLIDQDIKDTPGVYVPFFGRPAWTPKGAAMLALRSQYPIIPAFGHRLPNGTHKVVVYPPLPLPDGGATESNIEELTATATATIERQIRAYPEQWVWIHRRWRTQPE